MNAEPVLLLALVMLAGGLGVWFILHFRRKPPTADSQNLIMPPGLTPNFDRTLSHQRQEPVVYPTEALILGEPENPLVEITPMDFSTDNPVPIKVDSGLKSALQPLLQRSSEMFRVGEKMSTKSLRVVFSPAVTRGLSTGSLELVEASRGLLPVARNASTGRFVQTGKVLVQSGVRLAEVAEMSWQILAIATAQHYLGEINERLATIERGIDDIHSWLKEEKKAELCAAVHLLRQYYDAIVRGQLHHREIDAIYKQFEEIELTCLAIGELGRAELQKQKKKLEDLDVRDWADRSGSAERAKQWVKDNREALELVFLAQSCRILACQVKSSLPGDRHLLCPRIEHAQHEVVRGVQEFRSMRKHLMKKVRKLKKRSDNPIAVGGIFDDDYRRSIAKTFHKACAQASKAEENFLSQSNHVLELSTHVEQLANSGLTLDVRVSEQGEIEVLAINPASS